MLISVFRVWMLTLAAALPAAAQIRGVVRDAATGEPLARVALQIAGAEWRAVTGAEGQFTLNDVPTGSHTLTVSTVGYRMLRRPFTVVAGTPVEFDIALQPEILRRTERVSVDAGPFDLERADAPAQRTLAGAEARNLASVLADDPLRAVQSLPGVASNDDFNARFALRGADYRRLGLYLDGILLHQPFHSIQGEAASGSLTLMNGDLLEQVSLYPSAWPAKFGDRTAGILDLGLREGSRSQIMLRGAVSASNAGLTAEGPLGKRGAWLASTRKSYLQYIINRTSPNQPLTFGFTDGQARLTYDLTNKQRGGLSIIDGYSSGDRMRNRDRLGANAVAEAEYRATLLTADWRYAPRAALLATSRVAWMRERFENRNRELLPLASGHYGEWVWNANLTAMLGGRHAFDAGASVRRLRDNGFTNQYQFNPFAVRPLNRYRGGPVLASGYAQQQWSAGAGRFHLTAGTRWDRHSVADAAAVSPYAAAGVKLWRGASLDAGWGQAVQWPEPLFLYSIFGGRGLLPERATHVTAGIEQRLDSRTRLRVEAYQRLDRDLLFRPQFDPRLIGNAIFNPPLNAPIRNSSRGYARGMEVFLQRRSANRITGWIAYAYGVARQRDGVANVRFPADFDQRHTVNVYTGYRIRPTANLSTRVSYGSGFPIPGFLRRSGAQYFLDTRRNQLRLDPYVRVDVRANKDFTFDRWKLTLYAECINVTNRTNRRFDSFNGYNGRTGQAFVGLDTMFPVLPSAGLVLEFTR